VKDMTLEQAQAEALRRWGAGGTVTLRRSRSATGSPGRFARFRCTVSNGLARSIQAVEGQGDTWAEAFADARPR
jgi:hypothetical protein